MATHDHQDKARDMPQIDRPEPGFFRLRLCLMRRLRRRSQQNADEASKIVAKILAGIALR